MKVIETIKHTPGPWALTHHGAIVGGEFREFTNGHAQSQIAMACAVESGPATQAANARLIAAAPELLEALELVLESFSAPSDVLEKVQAAICKAKGEL